jgi:hypothetical protein
MCCRQSLMREMCLPRSHHVCFSNRAAQLLKRPLEGSAAPRVDLVAPQSNAKRLRMSLLSYVLRRKGVDTGRTRPNSL